MKYRIFKYTKKLYPEILGILFDNSNAFSVCVYKHIHKKELSAYYYNFLERLSPYELDKTRFVLPDYRIAGQQYHMYSLNKITKKMILEAKSLENWHSPDFPFDLSFYYNKSAFIWYITMEDLFVLNTENKEIINGLNNLGLVMIEET